MKRPPFVDFRWVEGPGRDRNRTGCTREHQETRDPYEIFHSLTLPSLAQARGEARGEQRVADFGVLRFPSPKAWPSGAPE
jgi:hypothetical protein